MILLLIVRTKNQREIREEMSELGHLISVVYKSKFHSNQNSLCLQMKKSFSDLLDTAVDISVIPVRQWPSKLRKMETVPKLQGIGQTQNPEQSRNELY